MTALERDLWRSADRLAGLQKMIRDGHLAARHRAGRRPGEVLVSGAFIVRQLDPDGSVAADWDVLPNGATYDGLNDGLEVMFRSGTQRTAWCIGIISATSFTGVSVNDTMSSHSGWSEYTGYSDSTRKQWSPPAASAGVLANTTVVTFTNGVSSASIQGIFLSTDSTKGGTTGKLWATAPEGTPRTLAAAQSFQVIYQITLTPG